MNRLDRRRRGRAIRRARRHGNLNQYLATLHAWTDAYRAIRRAWNDIRKAARPAIRAFMQAFPATPKRQLLHNGKAPRRPH